MFLSLESLIIEPFIQFPLLARRGKFVVQDKSATTE
jgi:hypothetical protein